MVFHIEFFVESAICRVLIWDKITKNFKKEDRNPGQACVSPDALESFGPENTSVKFCKVNSRAPVTHLTYNKVWNEKNVMKFYEQCEKPLVFL